MSKVDPEDEVEGRRRGIDPVLYLRDVLTRLPRMLNSEVARITPEAWAKAQRRSPQVQAA